ncbi:MAG: hypothetical protein AAGF24_03705, partial [Cyanobacteria bacterium P01_H01_bin.121]
MVCNWSLLAEISGTVLPANLIDVTRQSNCHLIRQEAIAKFAEHRMVRPGIERLLKMVSTLAEAVDLAGQVILSSQIADGLDAIGSSYRETINQAKELRDKEKEGIALTEEELALQQRLREEGSQGVVELDALIQQFRSFWAT